MMIKNINSNIRNKNSQNFWDVSSLSQAYVFYKLSQISVKQRKVKLRNKHSNEAGDPCEAFFKKMECSVDPT